MIEGGDVVMNAEQMWNEYKKINNNIGDEYQSWSFGVDADLLAELVVKGEKTATSSAYPLYEIANEDLPTVGTYDIILNSSDEAICIIQTTKVYVVPFGEVTDDHAIKEGEGDKSLDFWRDVHREFFTMCMNKVGKQFNEEMKVVCEEFHVVFK